MPTLFMIYNSYSHKIEPNDPDSIEDKSYECTRSHHGFGVFFINLPNQKQVARYLFSSICYHLFHGVK